MTPALVINTSIEILMPCIRADLHTIASVILLRNSLPQLLSCRASLISDWRESGRVSGAGACALVANPSPSESEIVCLEDGELLRQITPAHLRQVHGIRTLAEYRAKLHEKMAAQFSGHFLSGEKTGATHGKHRRSPRSQKPRTGYWAIQALGVYAY